MFFSIPLFTLTGEGSVRKNSDEEEPGSRHNSLRINPTSRKSFHRSRRQSLLLERVGSDTRTCGFLQRTLALQKKETSVLQLSCLPHLCLRFAENLQKLRVFVRMRVTKAQQCRAPAVISVKSACLAEDYEFGRGTGACRGTIAVTSSQKLPSCAQASCKLSRGGG